MIWAVGDTRYIWAAKRESIHVTAMSLILWASWESNDLGNGGACESGSIFYESIIQHAGRPKSGEAKA
jgi:hypothetical protein